MRSWTDGEKRADRIIQAEMLTVGDAIRHARSYSEWETAMYQLDELGKAAATVHAHGKRPPYMGEEMLPLTVDPPCTCTVGEGQTSLF